MILRVEGVGQKIGNRCLLKNVSFEIDKGMVLALCGPSGSGKTMLVRIISGLMGFDAGRLVLGDWTVEAGSLYPNSLYGKVGVVFQDHNLFPHMTARQNVELALLRVRKMSRSAATKRATIELEKVGLNAQSDQYPSSLSGGERQRVAIARALAMDPMLLLLDEPTHGLDSSLMEEVLNIIARLSGTGTTMMIVTHNLKFAMRTATRFALIEDNTLHVSDNPSLLDRFKRSDYD